MTPYRLLLTGSRHWADGTRLLRILLLWRARCPGGVLVHGDCRTGADFMAHNLWHHSWGLPVERHPADWSRGRKAGPIRNQHMVALGADVCLAFPLPDSRGTFGCARAAEQVGIPTWYYFPDRVIPALAGPRAVA